VRVVIVNNHARVTGGVDRHCLDIATALRSRGDEVQFLSTDHPDNEESSGGLVRLTTDRTMRDRTRGARAALVASRAVWNPDAARAMEALVDSFRPDVVHAHRLYPQLSVAPIVVAARRGIGVVQTAQDYEFVSANARSERGRLDRLESERRYRVLNSLLFAIRRRVHVPRVNAWIVPAAYVAERYAHAGIEARVLPNFTRAPTAPARDLEDRSGVIFVGRLQAEKGVRHVIELARATSLPVRIAGDGDLRTEVCAAARELPNLEYLGTLPRERVLTVLAESRVCAMPSLWSEPGAITSLEAMSVGTPVVAYDVGGLGDYVSASAAGICIAPSAAGLIEECLTLIEDTDRWRRYSANGLLAVQGRHSAESYVHRLLEIYADARGRPHV
jgi:glycosyltransferase involved in cell wall biosynthesis